MKTENITKALQAYDLFLSDLRAAYSDANNSENQFAHIVYLKLLEEANQLKANLERAHAASTET